MAASAWSVNGLSPKPTYFTAGIVGIPERSTFAIPRRLRLVSAFGAHLKQRIFRSAWVYSSTSVCRSRCVAAAASSGVTIGSRTRIPFTALKRFTAVNALASKGRT